MGKNLWLQIFLWLIMLAVVVPAGLILLFRFVPVPGSPQMLLSLLSGHGAEYHWVAPDRLPPALARAVLAAEDQRFCQHNGFDWTSIDQALKDNKRGKRLRGASTISQQAARSLFLTPARNWLRKGAEAWLTVLLEALWPKHRIMTAYLNLVDWGHGNFGAEAAARAYFQKPAARLSTTESARLAAILPDPHDWSAARPGPYVARRTAILTNRISMVRRDGLDACLRRE